MTRTLTILLTLAAVAHFATYADIRQACAEDKEPAKLTYDDHVKPILKEKCFSCHNPDKKSSDLDLTNYTNLMQGGASGAVVEAGDSSSSYLYMLVSHQEEPFMPPESPKIPDEMTETIRRWIDGGLLENSGSKFVAPKKKTFDLALQDVSTERPAVAPMPARLSLEPVAHTQATTAVAALATSPWASLVAIAGQKQVFLYHTQSLELLGTLPFPEGTPYVLKFSRNGNLLLAGGGRGGASGKVIVWNVITGERIFEIGDELDAVLAADISSDQTLIALGGPQRVVRVYSTETGELTYEIRKHTDWVRSLEFSPDSVLLASGDRAGNLYVWEGWTGREYLTLKGHGGAITGTSWRSDSNVLASCSEDGSIRLWEMENGGQIKSWGAHGGGAASVEFARDGRLVSCGRDRVPKLWDQNGKQQRAFEAFSDLALQVSICDETNRAIAGDWNGEVRVWNASDGAPVGVLTTNPPSLAERYKEATMRLASVQAEYEPLSAAYQSAQSVADKATADLAAAQAAMSEAQKRLDLVNSRREATRKTVNDANAALDAARLVVAQLEPAVPKLKEALAKANEAGQKLSGDKEFTETIDKLRAIVENRSSQLEMNRKAAIDGARALETLRQQLATNEQEATAATQAMSVARQNVEKLAPAVKPSVDKAAAAKQAAEQASAAVAAAHKQVDRWKDEIGFHNRLSQLNEQLSAAREQLLQREEFHAERLAAAQQVKAELDRLRAERDAAEQAEMAARKQAEFATVAVTTAKQQHSQAGADHQISVNAVTILENVITNLNEALVKAQEAAKISAGDPALSELVTMLQKVANVKTAEKNLATAAQIEKAKTIEAAKQQITTAEAKLAAANAALQAAQKRVAETSELVQKAEQNTAASRAADGAAKAVAAARQDVDRLRDEIATVKGLESGAG